MHKQGFLFYSLMLVALVICMLVRTAARTTGFGLQAARTQLGEFTDFARLLTVVSCHHRLIMDRYDFLKTTSVTRKAPISLETECCDARATFVCDAKSGAEGFTGLRCQTIIDSKIIRWVASKKGETCVFSGHTFTST